MHTTVAWQENQNEGGAWVREKAIEDQHIRISGDKIYVGDFNYLIGEHACCGLQGSEVRFVSPSLRRINPFYISPVDGGLTPKNSIGEIFHPLSPVKLETNEALEVEIKVTDSGSKEKTIAAFLAPGAIPPVHGEVFTINAEATLTPLVDYWVYKELTFPDSLPVGQFDVVGARVLCALSCFFRLVPVGEPYRPGGVCVVDANGNDPPLQRFGGLGRWFSFSTIQPPGIEILGTTSAGSTDVEILLDVIKR